MADKKERPISLPSTTDCYKLGCGNTYITISYLDNKPFEVFVNKGHSTACGRCVAGVIGKVCSIAIRSGINVKDLTEHLEDINCGEGYWKNGIYISSCFDAIAKSLSIWRKD